MIIRPFNTTDITEYESLARLYSDVYPEESATAAALKLSDIFRDRKYLCKRFAAEENGAIVGIGGFEHRENAYHPDKYFLHVIVNRDRRKQGIGSTIYMHISAEAEKLKAQNLYVWVQKECAECVAFAENRGFVPGKLKWNMALDLTGFDETPFLASLENVYKQGIKIKMFSEFAINENAEPGLYELYIRTIENINSAVELSKPDFAEYSAKKQAGDFDNVIVAEHDNRFVGLWQLEPKDAFSVLGASMQVDESYRKRGLGWGLGVFGIIYAKKNFFKEMTVDTDEHNTAILTLTEKLGFAKLPAQILMEKNCAS